MRKALLTLLLCVMAASAENMPIMNIDSFADVYYDAETGNPIVSDEIKALNGKTVRIAGYMVPFNSLENLKEFMLMPSSNGCNFCESPIKEEIIYVKQSGNKVFDFIDEPLVITGKLWINGAGTEPKNKTFAQFLYAFEDAKVEKLEQQHHALLEKVTPRTIIKQVCSLLKVRLLKQVKFLELDDREYEVMQKQRLLKYLGGKEKAAQLQDFLTTLEVQGTEELLATATSYLGSWSSAFSDQQGQVIYYRKGLDLSTPENQRQIAIACYDVLFHHEVEMGNQLHKGTPTYDEYMARLSLILGLRQSFTQFYGSIGLVDLKPLKEFAQPHRPASLPEPLDVIRNQLLLENKGFIEEVYKAESLQPYTKAIQAPPKSMKQVLTPSLYTSGKAYDAKELNGYQDRFGAYLTSLILSQVVQEKDIITDGINFTDSGFTWEIKFTNEKAAQSTLASLADNQALTLDVKGNTLTISTIQ